MNPNLKKILDELMNCSNNQHSIVVPMLEPNTAEGKCIFRLTYQNKSVSRWKIDDKYHSHELLSFFFVYWMHNTLPLYMSVWQFCRHIVRWCRYVYLTHKGNDNKQKWVSSVWGNRLYKRCIRNLSTFRISIGF